MTKRASFKKQSAGLLLFRDSGNHTQVLLGHPGGPFWSRKDQGAWTIPKGLVAPGESPLSTAQREFEEETGHCATGSAISLGSARQPGGKVVHIWAVESDWNPTNLKSNLFEMEWPPRSGRLQTFPEIDRADWFDIAEARIKIIKGQAVFIDRLLQAVGKAAGS
jgi:predicted NUDIX family NTP pyrophosphohydrolase